MQRVLMTADTVGGVWTFALDLAREFGSNGIEVMLATLGREPSPAQWEEASAISNLRLAASRYKLEWMDDSWEDVKASEDWVLELEKDFTPDVVHLNSFGHQPFLFRAPVVLTAHSCVLSWWSAVKSEPVPPSWNRYRTRAKGSMEEADLLTVPSRAMFDAIREHYGPDLPPIRVVPNGRPPERFHSAAKEPIILAAGRLWDEAKNIAGLAQVAGSLPWPIYVAGDDHAPDESQARMEGCCPLGRLTPADLANWYARAAIYALPARYEPFGLSVLEAAFSRCALVLGDIASLREIWDDAALFVPPGDSLQLISAIRSLIQRPYLRQEMARRSLARAQACTADRMAKEYLDVYESLFRMRSMACVS